MLRRPPEPAGNRKGSYEYRWYDFPPYQHIIRRTFALHGFVDLAQAEKRRGRKNGGWASASKQNGMRRRPQRELKMSRQGGLFSVAFSDSLLYFQPWTSSGLTRVGRRPSSRLLMCSEYPFARYSGMSR